MIRLPHIWTDDEAVALRSCGWFYGIGSRDGRLGPVEVYPGIGLCFTGPSPWWSPRALAWFIIDCFRYRP